MKPEKTLLTIGTIILLGLSNAFADVLIVIKGGRTHDDGTVTYRKVEMRFDNNNHLQYKECKGRGPNTCPKTGIITVGGINIDVEEEIYPVILKELEAGNDNGKKEIKGLPVEWKDAYVAGKETLEAEITIYEKE